MGYDPAEPRNRKGEWTTGGTGAAARWVEVNGRHEPLPATPAERDEFAGDPKREAARAFAADVNARIGVARADIRAAADRYAADATGEYARLQSARPVGDREEHAAGDAGAAVRHAESTLTGPLAPVLGDPLSRTVAAETLGEKRSLSRGDLIEDMRTSLAAVKEEAPVQALAGVPAEHRAYVAAHEGRVAVALEHGTGIDPDKVFARDDEGRPALPDRHARAFIARVNAEAAAGAKPKAAYAAAAAAANPSALPRLKYDKADIVDRLDNHGELPRDFFDEPYQS